MQDLKASFAALFHENNSLKTSWEKEQLDGIYGYRTSEEYRNIPIAHKLIVEAVEYFLIKQLSLHLSTHYQQELNEDSSDIVILEREDFPSVLLSNRFLELLTRPMEERDAFQRALAEKQNIFYIKRIRTDDNTIDPEKGEIVSATVENGPVFDRIEITLPKNTTVQRRANNAILITSQSFSVELNVRFFGFTGNTAPYFETIYLRRPFRSVRALQCEIDLQIKVSILSLLVNRNLNHLEWIEGFSEKIRESADFETFVQTIGWETALTSYLISHKMVKNRNSQTTTEIESSDAADTNNE